MKKKFFPASIAFLILGTLFAGAQSPAGFGIKAGINIADQVTSGEGEFVDIRGLVRFNGGGYFNYFFLEKFGAQVEVLLSGKGSDWDDPIEDVRDLLTYIDVPVLLRYQPAPIVNIHAGPQFGYLLKAIQKGAAIEGSEDIMDFYRKADIGLVVGVEANLPFRANLAIRYVFGLNAVTNDVGYIDPWRNNFFQISAGYRFAGK